MGKELHLEFLRGKYIQLSREYLNELHRGKTVEQLKGFAEVINILIKEIDVLEKDATTTSE
jgi:hypothetical protein